MRLVAHRRDDWRSGLEQWPQANGWARQRWRTARAVALLCVCLNAFGQGWRQSLMGLPERPPASTSVQDLNRFHQNVRLATPYFAGLQPGEYQANRDLIRRMVTYLAGVDLISRDPQLRGLVNRGYMSVAALSWGTPWGGGMQQQAPQSSAAPMPQPVRPSKPPFSLEAPAVTGVAEADKAKLADLQERYEFATSRASAVWQSAEALRGNLQSQGFALNTVTEASLARIQLYLELAAGALRAKEWPEAQTNIERADYETEKVRKTTGR